MKKQVSSIVALLIVVGVVMMFLFANGDIGHPKAKLEQEMRQSQHIAEDWKTVGVASHDLAAYISYPDTKETHVFSIYVNRPGLSFGWFFRGGGTLSAIDRGILEAHLEEGKQHAFLSMNHAGVVRVEIDDGTEVKTVELEPEEPFVLVLPTDAGNITFYAADGTIVEPEKNPI